MHVTSRLVSVGLCLMLLAATMPLPASAAIDKDASYQEMLSLASQMKSLKPQIDSNAQAAAD